MISVKKFASTSCIDNECCLYFSGADSHATECRYQTLLSKFNSPSQLFPVLMNP